MFYVGMEDSISANTKKHINKSRIKLRAGILKIKHRQLVVYKSLFDCLDIDGDERVELEVMKKIAPCYNTLVKVFVLICFFILSILNFISTLF